MNVSACLFLLRFCMLLMVSLCGATTFAADLPLSSIRLPPGFTIDIYTRAVPGARSMALGARGTLFVGTRETGKVYAVKPVKGGEKGGEVIVVASGLKM